MNRADKKDRMWILLVFMFAHAANDGYNAIFPPLLPLIREHYNLSYAQLGGFLTAFRFFGDYLQLPVGYLVHFLPSVTIIISGLLWLSIGILLATFAGSYLTLTSCVSVAGIGRASYHPLSFSLLSRTFPGERLGRTIGLHMGASSAAWLIAPFLIILLANRYGWYWPLRLWSLYGISMAFLLLVVLRKRMEQERKVGGKALKLPFFSSSLVFYIISRMFWSMAREGIMNAFLPLFLVEKAHFSIKSATLYYIAMYGIELVARPTIGGVSDKIGKRKPLLLCEYVLCGILFLLLTFFQTKLILLIIILGMGLFAGTIPVVGHAYAIEMIPREQREKTLAFLFTANTATITFAPLLFGSLADYLGLTRAFMILPLLIGMSTFFLLFSKEG
jgi:MFS family permease